MSASSYNNNGNSEQTGTLALPPKGRRKQKITITSEYATTLGEEQSDKLIAMAMARAKLFTSD